MKQGLRYGRPSQGGGACVVVGVVPSIGCGARMLCCAVPCGSAPPALQLLGLPVYHLLELLIPDSCVHVGFKRTSAVTMSSIVSFHGCMGTERSLSNTGPGRTWVPKHMLDMPSSKHKEGYSSKLQEHGTHQWSPLLGC